MKFRTFSRSCGRPVRGEGGERNEARARHLAQRHCGRNSGFHDDCPDRLGPPGWGQHYAHGVTGAGPVRNHCRADPNASYLFRIGKPGHRDCYRQSRLGAVRRICLYRHGRNHVLLAAAAGWRVRTQPDPDQGCPVRTGKPSVGDRVQGDMAGRFSRPGAQPQRIRRAPLSGLAPHCDGGCGARGYRCLRTIARYCRPALCPAS